MANQSKVNWTDTNLAKKMEKVIRKQPAKMNKNTKSKQTKMKDKSGAKSQKIKCKKGANGHPKTIVATNIEMDSMDIINPQIQRVQNMHRDHQNAERLPNDSLSADEIRCNLPQPITLQSHPSPPTTREVVEVYGTDTTSMTVSMTDDHLTENHDGSQCGDRNEDEEKAIEIGTTVGNGPGPYESIQIPQHTFEFGLYWSLCNTFNKSMTLRILPSDLFHFGHFACFQHEPDPRIRPRCLWLIDDVTESEYQCVQYQCL